ncbi:MAG TPA: class I SAM-dependent methyltransferase, partial [Gammaproteobacteria bacterium]|nr:class I SAM-dependent methyltransferase [Gammaproteobacteria bacterium]
MMSNIYTSGKYLETTQTWHAEDSPWKAEQILRIIGDSKIHPDNIAELGCGGGVILEELSKKEYLRNVQFKGYDISPQAIELCKKIERERVSFFCQDLLSDNDSDHFDILLVIDVFEHIRDYMGFLEKCRNKAEYKIYHIPLDIHVSSVLRNAFIGG